MTDTNELNRNNTTMNGGKVTNFLNQHLVQYISGQEGYYGSELFTTSNFLGILDTIQDIRIEADRTAKVVGTYVARTIQNRAALNALKSDALIANYLGAAGAATSARDKLQSLADENSKGSFIGQYRETNKISDKIKLILGDPSRYEVGVITLVTSIKTYNDGNVQGPASAFLEFSTNYMSAATHWFTAQKLQGLLHNSVAKGPFYKVTELFAMYSPFIVSASWNIAQNSITKVGLLCDYVEKTYTDILKSDIIKALDKADYNSTKAFISDIYDNRGELYNATSEHVGNLYNIASEHVGNLYNVASEHVGKLFNSDGAAKVATPSQIPAAVEEVITAAIEEATPSQIPGNEDQVGLAGEDSEL